MLRFLFEENKENVKREVGFYINKNCTTHNFIEAFPEWNAFMLRSLANVVIPPHCWTRGILIVIFNSALTWHVGDLGEYGVGGLDGDF